MASSSTLPRPTQPEPAGVTGPSRPRWWRAIIRLEPLAALVLAAAVFGAVQMATRHIIGIDGQYHVKVAALVREHGPRLHFPWLRFTLLNEAGYSDHHELLHLLQAPFTLLEGVLGQGEGLILAAKLSAWLFATLSFGYCYFILRRLGVRWPLAWLALMLAISPLFVWRHSMARAQSLSLLLLVAVLWAVFERRQRWLVPLGFIGAWLFDGSLLVVSVPLAALVARLLAERRLDWQPSFYLGAGVVLGWLLHPYFPNNVILTVFHLLPKLGLVAQEEVPTGTEWLRFSSTSFITRVGPSLVVMIAGMLPTLVRLWREEPPEYRSLTITLLAFLFLALVVRSQRIIEYFPAFAVLTAAFSWSFTPLPSVPAVAAYIKRWRPLLVGLVICTLALGLVVTVRQARRTAVGSPLPARQDTYREPALWLAANSPTGSLVFNIAWDDFPQLFFWNTHNVYVVGLDPTRMSLYDPELYRLWRSIGTGGETMPSVALRERFGASYVFSDFGRGRFLAVAALDPGLEEVFRSDKAVVFRVRAAP